MMIKRTGDSIEVALRCDNDDYFEMVLSNRKKRVSSEPMDGTPLFDIHTYILRCIHTDRPR